MMLQVLRRTAVVSLLLIVLAVSAFAQSDTGTIAGFVRDATGGVIANAKVTIVNEATQLERRTATNETGYYSAANLPPGFYTVSVEATGFKKYTSTNNKLDANVALAVNADLQIGQLTESVEVVASAAQLQTETATVGKTVEERQIKELMLNGRNPLFLALLKPGVRGGALSGFSFGLSSGGFAINGARTQDLLIAFDGAVGIRTRSNGTSVGTADLETIQEVQILTANYNAEYGRSAGGQIRFVSKSGSRDFHGTAYDYLRNRSLDANTWARNRARTDCPAYDANPACKASREKNNFNQFGYNISGPLFIPGKWNTERNKLFWLWSQEWVKRRRDVTSIQTVPSALMRNGDFSELLNPANTFFSRVRTINDPTTGAPFPGNIIPPARVSPNGKGLLSSYPLPTPGFQQGTSNFIQTRPQPENQRKDSISVDFMPTEKHTFRIRRQTYSWVSVDAFRSGFDRAVTDWDRPNQTNSVNYIWTISPTMVNEFTATASNDVVKIGIDRTGERYDRAKFGITYNYIYPVGKEIFNKIPTVNIQNFATMDGGPYPASSSGPIYTFGNHTSKIIGNHTIKFGAFYEHLGQNDFDQINVDSSIPGATNNQNGRFVFSDSRAAGSTGVAVANAAMGLFNDYGELGPRNYTPYRGQTYEFFAQDSWRVNQKLKLEYGIRYTLMTPYFYSLWRNMSVFDPSRYDPAKAVVMDPRTGVILSGDQYNGVIIPGSGWPDAAKGRVPIATTGEFDRLFAGNKYYGQWQKNNWQPRFGLAYQVTPKTVLRLGGGSFFARPGVADNIFLGGNAPFQPMISVQNGIADQPGGATAAARLPFLFQTQDPVFKIPSAWKYSVGLQREVGFDTTVEISYVGNVGLHMEREKELNALRPGTAQQLAAQGLNQNSFRPYRGFSLIRMNENAARSEYNGMQLELNRRFRRGLSYGFAYTLSKSMDNASQRRNRLINPFDDKNYWGKSEFDTRHIAVINWIYELPFWKEQKGWYQRIAGGWQVTGVIQFQTGTPFSVGTGEDFAGIGVTDAQLWNQSGTPEQPKQFSQGAADSNFWFNPTLNGSPVFTRPAAGTFANQNRNSIAFNNVGFQNWNLALFKGFPIGERHRVQFRAEFFNFPNHPNWNGVDASPTSGTFGKVTGKSSNREIQLSLRYSF
jgi:hypothetical protein